MQILINVHTSHCCDCVLLSRCFVLCDVYSDEHKCIKSKNINLGDNVLFFHSPMQA